MLGTLQLSGQSGKPSNLASQANQAASPRASLWEQAVENHTVSLAFSYGETVGLASSAESSAHLPGIFRRAGKTTSSLRHTVNQ